MRQCSREKNWSVWNRRLPERLRRVYGDHIHSNEDVVRSQSVAGIIRVNGQRGSSTEARRWRVPDLINVGPSIE